MDIHNKNNLVLVFIGFFFSFLLFTVEVKAEEGNSGVCVCGVKDIASGIVVNQNINVPKEGCEPEWEKDGKKFFCAWKPGDANDTDKSGSPGNLLGSVEGISDLNQIKKYNNLQGLIGGFIKTAMGVMGSIALIMVVYGGFTAMTAAGNAERVKKGTEILLWSGLGIVVIFASYALVDLVFEAFR